MFLFPSLHQKAIFCIAQAFLILLLLAHINQAAVIKKRDLSEIESTRLSQNDPDSKERHIAPTLLTMVNNESENVSTRLKLQPVSSNLTAETSKEFSNNEISSTETKQQLDQDLKSSTPNQTSTLGNTAETKTTQYEEIHNTNHSSITENEPKTKLETAELNPDSSTVLSSNIVKEEQINRNLDKLEDLNPKTELSSNVIKVEKLQKEKEQKTEVKLDSTKLTDRFKQLEMTTSATIRHEEEEKYNENFDSIENSVKFHKEKPRPPSQILTELKTDSETVSDLATTSNSASDIENKASKVQTTQSLELNKTSESLQEHLEDQVMKQTAESKLVMLTESIIIETTTVTPNNINETFNFETFSKSEEKSNIKTLETSPKEPMDNQTSVEVPKTSQTTNTATMISQNGTEIFSSGPSSQLNEIKIIPLDKTSKAESSSDEAQPNSIHDGLDREDLSKSSKSENVTETTTMKQEEIKATTLLTTSEEDSTLLGVNKMDYARSMSRESQDEFKEKIDALEEATTLQSNNDNEILTTTTPKHIVLSIKDSAKESTEESNKESPKESAEYSNKESTNMFDDIRPLVGEKKPKFINDNTTNVQHLNIPNNAESWNLASMKSLPKANVTIDTAQKHNITNDIKEENLQSNTFSVNNISEKNLLDWSTVLKEFSTTNRNQNIQQKEEEEENAANQLNSEEKQNPAANEKLEKEKNHEFLDITTTASEYTLTQPSIESRESMPKIKSLIGQDYSTETITPNSTILSSTSDNNKTDKYTMNNHIETLTSSEETETTTTEPHRSQLNNNPSVSIEPNLNETNLTSYHTLHNTNDELNTTTGKPNVDVNVNNNVAVERATSATEATAGTVDMTTIHEQNFIELTTLSTLETGKQNASQNNVVIQQENNNVILEESLQNVLEKTGKDGETNKFENIELDSKITTTSEIPITTFRPTNLAITSTTSTTLTTPSFEQEVDQNGNEIQTQLNKNSEQKQSITAFEGGNNNSKTIEKHLSELEIETTTLEPIITTKKPENTQTSTLVENTTSFAKEEIKNEQVTNLDVTTQATTTPKNKDDDDKEDVTTIGSPVIETKFEKQEEIETTTTETTSTTVTPKTPVVFAETQAVATHNESSSTVKTLSEEDTTETQTNQGTEIVEEVTHKLKEIQDKVSETETDNNNETTTMGAYPLNNKTMKEEDETLIKLLDDTSTTTTTTSQPLSSATTEAATTTSTTATTAPSPITTTIEEIYKVIHTTTTEAIQTTTTPQLITESEESFSSTTSDNMIPTTPSSISTKMIETADIGKSLPTLTTIMGGNSGHMYPKNTEASGETDVNVIIAITVSVIGVIALILLVGFLYLMRKRQKQTSYSQRCRPVSLDEYTIDNASVGGSMRKSSALRSSKRTYGNLAFDDPSLRHNAMGVHELAKFVQEKLRIFEEFRDVPQITSRLDEVPQGCEDKNRYANVLPLPETRVILQRQNDDDKTEYINANYVTGPKDTPNYYIACQAPLDTTVEDFWRMIWEQQSRVIIQATDLIENGVEKCAEYLPPSVTLDNHSTFGDFQITLQNREVKDKYAISMILLKHVAENVTRELTHYWYKWPEVGVPTEEAPLIAMLLEARSSLISYAIEQANEDKEKSSLATLKSAEEGTANGTATSPSKDANGSSANGSNGEINGNINMVQIKKTARNQGPLTIHCSPGTGRTGTIIACDIAIRSLETPKRTVDIPQIVYYVRRGRASAVLTKEQYEFIYKVANMYAAKISNPTNYN